MYTRISMHVVYICFKYRYVNTTKQVIINGKTFNNTDKLESTEIATNENILLLDEYSKVKYFNTFFIEDFRK
jgi:hypothetical protein